MSDFQLSVITILTLGDVLVVSEYIRRHRGNKKSYGRGFVIHVVGGITALVLGPLVMALFALDWLRAAQLLSIAHGFSVVAMGGAFAFPMARYTSGLKGYNLVGYSLYSVAWIYSGVEAALLPSPETAYACFVLTHAYLTCRLFIVWLSWGWRQFAGSTLNEKLNYSVATTLAAALPLALAWGPRGLACAGLFVGLAVFLHATGVSSQWHALSEPGETLGPLTSRTARTKAV